MPSESPPVEAYVWVWLPGAADPVVAGRLDDEGSTVTFTYGRRYLARDDAIALYLPELPLRRDPIDPLSGTLAGCIADGGPDAWGRRVLEHRRAGAPDDLGPLGYLLASGSDRIGALDFQASPSEYHARLSDDASMEDLATVADRVEAGRPLPPSLHETLLHASSIGGARPKALLRDGPRRLIAKFSSSTDPFPVVQAEHVGMDLARRVGVDAAPVSMTTALGRATLLVERFDRTAHGRRRALVSALTILELHDADGMAGRYATYVDLAHQVRARFTDHDATLRELFARISFNILVGNTDDHARNHAAFWDGRDLTLTPAYDICPQNRAGGEAAQAMAYGEDGERRSQVALLIGRAPTYHLTMTEAAEIVERQIEVIGAEWDDACDAARLTTVDRQRLWGRQVLNPFALEGL